MTRIVILVAALATSWLVWSGLYKPLLLALGVLSVGLAVWLAIRMSLTEKRVFALDLVPRMLAFWGRLLVQIVKSNVAVARIILSPQLPISPTVIQYDPVRLGLVGQATLANSITLTPGTLTIDAHEGHFQIHCLTEAGADEVIASDFDKQIAQALEDR